MSHVLRKPKASGGSVGSVGSASRQIALLMPRANVHTRGIFRGVTRFARPFRSWNFHLGLPERGVVAALRKWKPAGIIATIPDPKLEARIRALGIPLVNCSSDLHPPDNDDRATTNYARVVTDNQRVGELAADHLLSQGFKHLAYCGEPSVPASRDREAAFVSRAAEAEVAVACYRGDAESSFVGELGWAVSSRDRALQRWVLGLPKPVGLFACFDHVAMLLGEVCREVGLDVPQQVALLGVDNDAMLCEMAYPTLSSVQTPQVQIGFEAARRLEQLMLGRAVEPQTFRLPPIGVVSRQSTDPVASDDALVARAMRFVTEHADQPIRVPDVVEHVGVSRRSLEYRFKAVTGQSVLDAIRQAHVDLANQLLARSSLSLEEIALASGFNSRERFASVYRQLTGNTPRAAFPRPNV